MSVKILFVDDEVNILDGFRRNLGRQFTIVTASSAEEAMRQIKLEGPFAVVVTDMHMPLTNGVQLLCKVREAAPDTVRMMLTGNGDLTTAMSALNDGQIFRFMIKPVSMEALAQVLSSALEQYRLVTSERELLGKTLRGVIRTLIEILSTTNPEMFGRAQGLRIQMRELSEALAVSDNWSLEITALLSFIGRVTMPTGLCQRADLGQTLTAPEQALIDRTSEIGYNFLAHIPRLEEVASSIRYMNKCYDGTGEPSSSTVSGDAIPIGARILKVLIDMRTYEAHGLSRPGALAIMRSRHGWYDPHILEVASKKFASEVEPSREPPIPVKLALLRPGVVLAENLETMDGKLLVAAGLILTDTLIETVKNFALLTGVKEPVFVHRPVVRTPIQTAA